MTSMLYFLLCLGFAKATQPDLTVVGRMKYADSMGRTSIWLIDCLKDDLDVNFISVQPEAKIDFADIPPAVEALVKKNIQTPGKVALLVEHPWFSWGVPAQYMPKSMMKIAYSMIESTGLPKPWKKILNNQFDAVVVPDRWLVEIYKNAGIQKPLFVIPQGIYLEDYLQEEPKKSPHTVFTFGMSGGFWPWKNHEMVIRAFAKEFKNQPGVQLILHGRGGDDLELRRLIRELQIKNVKLINASFTKTQFLSFMKSIDCYVYLSKGEGFSLTPREALALGIPCILSNHSVHKTICDSGFVLPVQSIIKQPAFYSCYGKRPCGFHFNCTLDDAFKALREVYSHYDLYLAKAHEGRHWTKQYLQESLKPYYLTLVKPSRVVLGATDEIVVKPGEKVGYIITQDSQLKEKYETIYPDLKSAY